MRKLVSFFVLVVMLFCASAVDARNGWQGCCSWHGGIAGYCRNGHMVCNDGTLSPSCLCDEPGGGYSYQNSIPPDFMHKSFRSADWTATQPQYALAMELKTINDYRKENIPIFTVEISSGVSRYPYSGFIDINNLRFYIDTRVDIPYKYFKEGETARICYSIDGGKDIEVNVSRVAQFKGGDLVTICFYAKDFMNFYYGLRRGKFIKFKIEDSNGSAWIEYSLAGFSYVYDKSILYLRSIF